MWKKFWIKNTATKLAFEQFENPLLKPVRLIAFLKPEVKNQIVLRN
jgi:hypothetical protein